MAEKKIIRFWFYPFGAKYSQKVNFSGKKFVCLQSCNHLDVLVEDKDLNFENDCKEKIEELIEATTTFNSSNNDVSKERKIIVFVHFNTKIDEVVEYFRNKKDDVFLLPGEIVFLSNGNAQSDQNYAALEGAISLVKDAGKKGTIISNVTEIKFGETAYKELKLSAIEENDKWEEFLNFFECNNIQQSTTLKYWFYNFQFNIWTFHRKFQKHKLLKLPDEVDYFNRIVEDEKVEIKQYEYKKTRPNIILAPGNLQYEKYRKALINEIIDRDVFGLKDFEKKSNDEKKKIILRPLIILCRNAGDNHLLNNSSIWYKCLGIDDLQKNKELDEANLKTEIKNWFETLFQKDSNSQNDISIYDKVNAKENLDYHLRLQQENRLASFDGGHNYITPKRYTNELQCKQQILDINEQSHPEIAHYNNCNFRILLIDDKDGFENETVKTFCKKKFPKSKAFLIKELMSLKVFDEKNDINKKTVWNAKSIEAYLFDKVEGDNIKLKCGNNLNYNENNTQIIQVTNLADAINLLSNDTIKFDLILMDYLLDKKDNNPDDRSFATDFFRFIKNVDNNNKQELDSLLYLKNKLVKFKVPLITKYKNDCDKCINIINDFVSKVKANRGPLQKFWIYPITAFNQTLKDDLSHHNIRMIDYYWHISTGADPLTTPFLFLRNLNNFLYLQLENSVFSLTELKNFILKSVNKLKNENSTDKEVLKNIIGAEYEYFQTHYANDALIKKDVDASLFANSITNSFYKNVENNKLLILRNKIQKLYHILAYGENRKEEALERLISLIEYIHRNDTIKNEFYKDEEILKEVDIIETFNNTISKIF